MLREEDVLQPATETDNSQWPEFSLSKTKVYSQETGKLTSLLAAHQNFLVRVEGQLEEVEDDQLHLIRNLNYRNKPVAIHDVSTYSFSQFEDGSLGFWAGGKAGWFEVKDPAKAFKEIYEGMKEATSMFYFLADKYRNSRKNMANASLKMIDRYAKLMFSAYLEQPDCLRDDAGDVREGFCEHRETLIASMLEGQDNLNWEGSPMLRWFKANFLTDFLAISGRVEQAASSDSDQESKATDSPQKVSGLRHSPDSDGSLVCNDTTDSRTPSIPVEQSNDNVEPEEDDDVMDLDPKTRNRKSMLRPKSSKSSKKAISRKESLLSIKKGERHSETDDGEEGELLIRDENDADAKRVDLDPVSQRSPDPTTIPNRDDTHSKPREQFRVKMMNHTIPSYEPQGPGDAWTCAFDGCNYKVYQARALASKEMIKAHFIDHAEKAQEQLDLIQNESRPYLSVQHLLRHVNDITSHQTEAFQAPRGPVPIKRKY